MIKEKLIPSLSISHGFGIAPITDHLAIFVVVSLFPLHLVVESPKLQGIPVAALSGFCGFTEVTAAKELPALPSRSLVRLADCSPARAARGSLQGVLPVIAARETGKSWTLAEHRLENPRGKSPSSETLLRRPLPPTSRRHDPPGADQVNPGHPRSLSVLQERWGRKGALPKLLFF